MALRRSTRAQDKTPNYLPSDHCSTPPRRSSSPSFSLPSHSHPSAVPPSSSEHEATTSAVRIGPTVKRALGKGNRRRSVPSRSSPPLSDDENEPIPGAKGRGRGSKGKGKGIKGTERESGTGAQESRRGVRQSRGRGRGSRGGVVPNPEAKGSRGGGKAKVVASTRGGKGASDNTAQVSDQLKACKADPRFPFYDGDPSSDSTEGGGSRYPDDTLQDVLERNAGAKAKLPDVVDPLSSSPQAHLPSSSPPQSHYIDRGPLRGFSATVSY